MNIVSILIASLIVILGIAYQQTAKIEKNENSITEQKLPTKIPTPLATNNNQIPETPTIRIVPSETPLPTMTPQPPQQTNLENWQFPDAIIVKTLGGVLELESTSEINIITQWYENNIKKLSYTARSLVKTTANEKTNNVLVVAKNSREIRIEITQENKNQKVHIRVSIKE